MVWVRKLGCDRSDRDPAVTLLLPWYLHDGFRDLFEAVGFRVLWCENRNEVERLLRESPPDLALEWQHGRNDFPVRDLLRSLGLETPVFLALNWDGRLPGNPRELGYTGWVSSPMELRPTLRLFADVLEPRRRDAVRRMIKGLSDGAT